VQVGHRGIHRGAVAPSAMAAPAPVIAPPCCVPGSQPAPLPTPPDFGRPGAVRPGAPYTPTRFAVWARS
jgi:hypothetical protein